MRKDIFIVGARLLGIWELLAAAYSLAYIIAAHIGVIKLTTSGTQEYYSLRFVVECTLGLFLIFRAHRLFNFLDRFKEKQDIISPDDSERVLPEQ